MELDEFKRVTAVVDSLPHAATIAKMTGNWREAADEFLKGLEARGYAVTKLESAEIDE